LLYNKKIAIRFRHWSSRATPGTPASITQKRQLYFVKQLKQKLVTQNAILVQAGEGKTIVVINTDTCVEKNPSISSSQQLPYPSRRTYWEI
jgi:hypothetical protein